MRIDTSSKNGRVVTFSKNERTVLNAAAGILTEAAHFLKDSDALAAQESLGKFVARVGDDGEYQDAKPEPKSA